jgi:hypothetical protein
MDDSERSQADIKALHLLLQQAYRRRLIHIVVITGVLFVAALTVIAGIGLIIYTNQDHYGGPVIMASTFQVLVLLAIILGLVVHGMSVGRMTSILVGVLRTSVGSLQREVHTLSQGLLPQSSSMQQVIEHIRERFGASRSDPVDADEPALTDKEQQYLVSVQQMSAILEELESTRAAAESQLANPDLAAFAYGFATICVLSSSLLFVGSTENTEFPRILMIGICLTCALSCLAVLRRPTGPQFVIEESLRKMGLSMEALTDSLRSRDMGLPPKISSDDLVATLTRDPEP